MSNRFFFGEDDSNTSLDDYDDSSTLPFPKPLDRAAFLTPEFDAATFLSSLSTNRFQTLEDLQDELRELSQSLSKELIDLVNDNYHEFLSLGSTLSGGEEKIEEIRVSLLAFQRDVGGVRDKVQQRKTEVADLLQQKKQLRTEINSGRILLEIAERLDNLEHKLRIADATTVPALTTAAAATTTTTTTTMMQEDTDYDNDRSQITWDDDWVNVEGESDEDDDDDDDNNNTKNDGNEVDSDRLGISTRTLWLVEQVQIMHILVKRHDAQHPWLVSQRDRILRIHETLRADLHSLIRQESSAETKQKLIKLRVALEDATT